MYTLTSYILILIYFISLSILHLGEGIEINKLQKLEEMIIEIREYLYEIINEKEDLLNPEVMAASKILDSILNAYAELIKNK